MTGIIIQARMGSSRLPGKVLKDFEGNTLLGHIYNRLKKINSAVKVIIATSDKEQDNPIEKFCLEQQIECFRGEEQNVLKRYYDCATKYQFQDIVRMTGDNPFPDIEELDRLIEFHKNHYMDFSENFSVLPIGVGMEIMSYRALKDSYLFATLPKHFEHADEYILDHLGQYKHGTVEVPKAKNKPEVRLTVDTPMDYDKACFILKMAKGSYVNTEDAITYSNQYCLSQGSNNV